MRNILKQRVLIARLATVAFVAGGLTAGYFLGRALSLQAATNWLNRYAELTATQHNAALAEARSVVKDVNAAPYPYCSDAEIAYYRGIVLLSQYLKDAGRIRNGKIDCSVASEHRAQFIALRKPDSRFEDGSVAYYDFPSAESAGSTKEAALKLGTAYVAFASMPLIGSGPFPIQLSAAIKNTDPRQASLPVSNSPWAKIFNWTSSSAIRRGDRLYATRCSTDQSICATASAPVAEAERSETGIVNGTTAAGGLFGCMIGIAFSFVFGRKRNLHQQLRQAVQKNQLQVLYQPIVVLSSRKIVGAEALARWTDEEGNAVDPEVFVKIAEERGFVGTLTKFVLRRALQDFANNLRNRPEFRLSVNVAGADLVDPAFLPMLQESLRQANVKPESVVIEISEKSAAKSEVAMETIRILRRMGHSIHIDDFGTGYSNLDKLLYMFADTIKIDKAFTGVIGTESVAVAILPQILAMAKSMGLEVVVEGVENDHQADYFAPDTPQLYGQGWLYGRPVTAVAFQDLLAGNLEPAFAAQESKTREAVSPEHTTRRPDPEWTAKPGALHIVPVRAA